MKTVSKILDSKSAKSILEALAGQDYALLWTSTGQLEDHIGTRVLHLLLDLVAW